MLTDLPDDIFIEILLQVDNKSLVNSFNVCRDIARLSYNSDLWSRKLATEYGPEYFLDKSILESYRDVYLNFVDPKKIWSWKVIQVGHLYLLKALKDGKKKTCNYNIVTLHSTSKIPEGIILEDHQVENIKHGSPAYLFINKPLIYSIKSANTAAQYGHIHILTWFEQQGILPNHRGADLAAKFGQIKVLIWLKSRKILPTQHGFQSACRSYRIDILDWLMNETKLRPNNVSVRVAAQTGSIEVLEWLETKGVSLKNCINHALKSDQVETVLWFIDKQQYPKHADILNICVRGQFDLLCLLVSLGFLPPDHGINLAIKNNHITIVKWFLDRGIIPANNYVDMALEKFHIELLRLLISKGFRPSQNLIDSKYNDNLSCDIKLLLSLELLPSDNILKKALSNDKLKFLDILIKHGCKPVKAPWCSFNGLMWIVSQGLEIDQTDVNIAMKNININALEWLLQKGYYPSKEEIAKAISLDLLDIVFCLYKNGMSMIVNQQLVDIAYIQNLYRIRAWLSTLGFKPSNHIIPYKIHSSQ